MSELLTLSSTSGLRRVLASELTPVDCDLMTGVHISGVGQPTDGTAAINAFLMSATVDSPVELILDGGILCTGITGALAGHWTISGMGWSTGFFVKSGSNATALRNGTLAQRAYYFSEPNLGQSITVRDIMVNGNRGDGFTGNSSSGQPQGNPWVDTLEFGGINSIHIENVWTYQSPTYGVMFSSCTDVHVSGCRFECVERAINTDGIHVNGHSSNIYIHDCWFGTGDDAIAVNCPEGKSGDIDNIIIDRCIFDTCLSMVRLYTFTSGSINTTLMSNCTSVGQTNRVLTGSTSDSMGTLQHLSIINCDFVAGSLGILASTGRLEMTNVRLYPVGGQAGGIELNIGTVNEIILTDVHVRDRQLTSFITGTGGTLQRVVINSLDPAWITALFSGNGSIATVDGPGVLATGYQFADAVMVNNVPYLSSDATGAPSIKLGGTAKRYNLT